jgi:hypothetical protein
MPEPLNSSVRYAELQYSHTNQDAQHVGQIFLPAVSENGLQDKQVEISPIAQTGPRRGQCRFH